MAWWNKVFGASGQAGKVAYYDEGLALIAEDKVHEALTSFRLALKASPGDVVVLQQIAMAYTRIGMTEEAEKTYRHVLQKDPQAAGAHYGVAFLLVRSSRESEAIPHLRAFLENAPAGQEASEHVSHAPRNACRSDRGRRGRVGRRSRMSPSKEGVLRWTGEGLAFSGRVGSGPTVTIDGAAKLGPSSTDSLLLGLMGCMSIDVLMILQKGRVTVNSLETRVEAERAPEPPKHFTRVRLTFVLDGPSPEERPKVDRAIQLSREKYCSVLHSLRSDLEFDTVVESV